ncbi:MAG: BamA/TamA family outer membrane protein [Candidatus Marinimicrobia bacterium]|nr:BamA/TamA family outer membrane protein [Candidatus Neomarinimicrobiota bacterium]MDD5061352.1 BamA/TamA family outer membrane protein [Candidatus Neomarinimicrobiota bacterium]MDD5230492.1 BamA/TamA family outer membrane protein [Candidatus Neomarinimicrobiota bacterium]MDD5539668.1 BamA/TamA family outer membrane protein [Candidatus Neomarinimicrobiota bacterium]
MKILHGNFRIYGLVLITLIFLWGETLFSKSEFRATEYYVNKITLIGNRQFSTRKLKKQINLKRKTIWRTQTFTRRVLELDRLNLESFYVRQGYLYCTVKDSFVVHPNSRVDVFFIIKEGQPYILKEITISGAESLSQKKVLNLLDHKINEPYNPIQIRNGIKTIITEYANIGRPLTTITDSLEINHDIRLFLRIRESKPIYVNRVIITNNKLVKEKPIRREVEFQSGDRYSLKKIDLSKRHIYETGLFSSVNIRLADLDTVQSKVDLMVEVRELDMRYLGLNFGFGQDRGVNEGKEAYTSVEVTGEWLNRNITGIGRRLNLKTEGALNIDAASGLSQPRVYGAVTWIEPWMLGFRSSNSFTIFAEEQWFDVKQDYYEAKYGGEVALIYQPERRLYLKTGLAPQRIISRLQTGKSENTEMAITLNFRRDNRDNFIFPKNGTYLTASGKIGLVSGGTANYYKLEPSYSRYFNIFGPVVLAYRGKIGIMKPLKAGQPTPQYEKFYLGGTTSLRGWLDNRFKTDDSTRVGAALGDDFKILTSAEIRFPLFWLLGGEIFIDGGNLVSDVKDLFDRRYRWNYGIGLTLATPLGPIRVDYAWKINQIGKESKGEIQFGIPYAF